MTGPGPASSSPWPTAVAAAFERSVTAEFATLTRAGGPITSPTTPYIGPNGTLDVSTGLTYAAKAERARRNPRVCLLFADPIGTRSDLPTVVVQGLASVRDADLQANTDRYVRDSTAKLPDATRGQPRFLLRAMPWYFARVWVEVTPVRIRWWDDRQLRGDPAEWQAPAGTTAPPSDPAPRGSSPRPWLPPPAEWLHLLTDAVARLPLADLTAVDADGYPLCLPVTLGDLVGDALSIAGGPGSPPLRAGPACLTLHGHGARFTGQENHTFVGHLDPSDTARGASFRVERALADWSLPGGRGAVALGFLNKGRRLRPRLAAEARRRGQEVPKVRFPR